MNKLILLIFFNGLILTSWSQEVNFVKYSVYDGLVANPVRCIYQDSKGFIWIGTFEGLSRYDGHKFSNYTVANGLSHDLINSIIEVNGKLLIAENNGAIDVIQNNTFQKGFKAASAVNVINPFRDRLLLTTDESGFYEYVNDTIVSPVQDKVDFPVGYFLGINDSLLLSAGGDNHLVIYDKDFNLRLSLTNQAGYIYKIIQDSKKRLWACTSTGLKLLQVHPGKKPSISFDPLPPVFNFSPLKNTAVTSMIEENDGSFWIGTLKGLVRLFPNGNFHVYDEKDGLPTSWINTLYLDKEENLWIGTSLGLAKWVSKSSISFFNTETQDFRNDVVSLTSTGDEKIILRTYVGLQDFNFETREFKNIKIPGSHYPVPISGTSPLLIQYGDRIGVLDSRNNTVASVTKLDTILPGITTAFKHPQGTFFLGTFVGVFAVHKTSVKKIMSYRITSMTIDEGGHIWAGTWEDGLFRISIRNNDEGQYDIVDMTPRIKEKAIRGLYTDSKKNIWIGTRYGGAFCLTPKANDDFDTRHFNRRLGLMSNWVISFAETKTDDIWIGTHLGIDKLVKEPSGYRVFSFSKAVNFFAEIKKIISFKDHWICVANTGIAIFKDENLHSAKPLQSTIFATSLGVFENKITLFLPTEKVSLKPFQNAARFEFGALGFINERHIMYSYRLKGSGDSTWSKPENIHEASYASLSPGNYTFEVKTIGWNGEEGIPASFSFYISTPFWKQWWFLGLCVLVIAAFFYALYRYRINQLLRLQTVRNNIAADLHDDIGSSLTNISILSELSKSISQTEKAHPFLQRISEEVQASSQAMDDIIWSVNSRNDSLQETMARMRRYAAELFDNSETNCHLHLDEKTANKKLTMEQRRDVYLIYKEALTNIHKHANAKNIWIDVNQHQNHLSMRINDDGKGFDTKLTTHRNGLKNLRSRIEKWKGKIRIESTKNKGTNIEIKIPLKDL